MLFATIYPPAARAADFSGKTIEFVIPFPTRRRARTWRFFALFRPESPAPTVVVKNVPGGGSITGTNQFVQRAKPDGLSIIGTSGSTQLPYLLDDLRVRYELKELIPVLVSPTGGVVYVNPTLGAQSARHRKTARQENEVRQPGAHLARPGAGARLRDHGARRRPVFGLARGLARVAFERGESLIDYQTSSAYSAERRADQGRQGGAALLLGVLNDKGEFVRDPTFPDLPHFTEAYEMAYGKQASGPRTKPSRPSWSRGFAAQKPIFLPKGTPKDIVDTYVQALGKVVKTPAFKEKAGDELGTTSRRSGRRRARR